VDSQPLRGATPITIDRQNTSKHANTEEHTINGADFVRSLEAKHYPTLEGPVLALRKALAELDPASPAFVALMQRQAKRELRHGVAFTKALLRYDGLAHHEKADVAEQAAEEYRHFAIIKDYLNSRGEDVEGDPVDAYDAYFDRFLDTDIRVFRLCNIAEKSAVVFIEHLRTVTPDPAVRAMADSILADEEEHGEMLSDKLARIADVEADRPFLEAQFIASWSSQKSGVIAEATELGIDVPAVLKTNGFVTT